MRRVALRARVQRDAGLLGASDGRVCVQNAGIVVTVGENHESFLSRALGYFLSHFGKRIEQRRLALRACPQDGAFGSGLVRRKFLTNYKALVQGIDRYFIPRAEYI